MSRDEGGLNALNAWCCRGQGLNSDRLHKHSPSSISRVGVDLAKHVFQIHAVNHQESVMLTKSMSPEKFFDWCRDLPLQCVVAMESCSGAHHVARRLTAIGLRPRIIAAHHVSPYRSAGARAKNDANDAAAICEASSRPHLPACLSRPPPNKAYCCCIACAKATKRREPP